MTNPDTIKKINELRKIRNAVILAHNYVTGEVQDIADFVGDSLELSIKAAATKAPVIVFCGVSFMAESAKLLSPESTVLQPEVSAGCPMADMASAEAVRELRKQHPDAVFVA
ncbi:MAG: quinolinate synthase NadA, partial [Lentisphaeria bacterium]|nr:quinolinate synthase NadA [Lentisphaeria bacterium]